MKRKLIAFGCVVASLVLLYLSCVNVSAAGIIKSGSCGDNVTYTLDSAGVLTISGTGRMYNYSYGTTPWGYDRRVNTIIISSGVTVIGNKAFTSLVNLRKVSISDSVTSIGEYAFHGCDALENVEISNNVTIIGMGAFLGCGVVSITIPDCVKNVGSFAFSECSYLEEVRFCDSNNGCTNVGSFAFENCISLENVYFGSSVKIIDGQAFRGCSSLKEIVIPDSVVKINHDAFKDCINLAHRTIAGSVKVDTSAFDGCPVVHDSWSAGYVITSPTCTSKGVQTCNCSVPGCTVTKTEEIAALGHKIVKDSAVAATCTKAGLTEGSHCSRCNSVIKKQNVTNALGHKIVKDSAVAATCTKTGLTEGSHCSRCNSVIKKQNATNALGHKVVKDPAVAATCTKTGLTEGSHCSVCNTVIKKQETVNAFGHKAVIDAAVAATCTKTGFTEGSHCSVCKTVITAQSTIPALGHDFSGPSKTNDDGTISYMCVNCGEYSTATIKDITGTKRLTQDNVDVLVAPVEMTASTVLVSANGAKITDKAGKEITDKNTYLATGMKVILGKTSVTISVAGDVDGSGDISVSDARLALRAAVKLDTLTGADFTSADVDFSGDISVSDARLILRAAVKLDDPKNAWIK